MANLKEVRERIASVISTQQITKAMKMVSAAKLRKAQQAIQQLRPYSQKLNDMLSNILSNLDGDAASAFSDVREVQNVAIVLVTSNRGLAGAFNANLNKAALRHIQSKYPKQLAAGKVTIFHIGKKGYDFFKRFNEPYQFNREYVNLFEDLSFDSVVHVPNRLMAAFANKEFDAVDLVYARFRNAAMQYYEVEQFLPVAKIEQPEGAKSTRADYIFEPNQKELLEFLVPNILQIQFQKALLDTSASEHGARMTAMDKATENANDLLRDLRINYNKARQEAITNEISEIVGGAAALEG